MHFSHGGLQIGTVKSWKDWDGVCRAIKLAQQSWRRRSIFSMARAASFMLMLEPHDRPCLDSGPVAFPQSPLNRWNRRCLAFFVDALRENPASVLCLYPRSICLKLPLEDTVILRFVLSASCRGHTANTAASAASIALADPPTPILPVRTSAWVLVARRHSYPPAWTVCACPLQQMNQFQIHGA